MVSRRNFISITIIMLTLVFMFQATQIYYEYIAWIDRNDYIPDQVVSGAEEWKPETLNVSDPYLDAQYVLFFGDAQGAVGNTVSQWCTYTKRTLVVYDSLSDFPGSIGKNQEFVLIESAHLNIAKDLATLQAFSDAGIDIVFCDLPDVQKINSSPALQQLLGIRKIQSDTVIIDGIRLFSDFLLGGEVIYSAGEDLFEDDMQMPWYHLSAGAQTYMVGLLDEYTMAAEDITRETLPAIMWSYSNGKGKVFAVNGDYLHDNTGVGILSAIDATLSEYTLYPILNAQLLTIANYPSLANENAETMQQLFSINMTKTGRDVIFPQLVSTSDQTGFIMSCMLQTQYDYMDANQPRSDVYNEYLKLMKQAGSEIGLSLDRQDTIALVRKLDEDNRFLESTDSNYRFGAVYSGSDDFQDIAAATSLPDIVNTVVSYNDGQQDLISFGNERFTIQSITSDASEHSFRSDLYMRSVQTALGYTNILLDMNRVFWPTENEISWEKLSKLCAENLYTYWYNFQSFEDATVSQNDQKIRQLLTLDYNHVQKENVIYVELENVNQPVNLILRLHNTKPEYVSGGTFINLENDTYLLQTTEQYVEIHLTSSNPIHN